MAKRTNMGEVKYAPVYNSTDYEVIIQTSWRGGPRRIALCTNETDAEAVAFALQTVIQAGIIT